MISWLLTLSGLRSGYLFTLKWFSWLVLDEGSVGVVAGELSIRKRIKYTGIAPSIFQLSSAPVADRHLVMWVTSVILRHILFFVFRKGWSCFVSIFFYRVDLLVALGETTAEVGSSNRLSLIHLLVIPCIIL
jgi:hypothetical protein